MKRLWVFLLSFSITAWGIDLTIYPEQPTGVSVELGVVVPEPDPVALEYLGYSLVSGDYDGNVSQSVTIPTGTTYALAYVGGDDSRTISAISLAGTSMDTVVLGSGAYGTNDLFDVAVSTS